mmetsp:Transcript_14309/g.45045  ORF Transcript_14309/g.45045 Transcript_14309/m.45045 type:complete len:355 (-) Transcript_14309:53-1117(-)|eukprot:CAMPEP_0170741668 /NCGR_PEP_ID=MMETSP0437-20130122/6344_1 /TAXON_ID=0 /ORGANISM="Sexangularia sp." /LENGTH=354 /DNA_ID=CAMNT_0011080259 /DNA_START=73 /DNA_END=1137 /DNA_ORIENTATION=-
MLSRSLFRSQRVATVASAALPLAVTAGSRTVGRPFSTSHEESHREWSRSSSTAGAAALVAAGSVALAALTTQEKHVAADSPTVDYDAVRRDIAELLDDEKYDDGSYGPVFVRLAWHASGTYDKSDGSGGSDGATMRFLKEGSDGANAGLQIARARLEPLIAKHPGLSHGDLWVLAALVAIEEMGGPKIKFHPGRKDVPAEPTPAMVNRLPDASQGISHVEALFVKRMGFTPRETVALLGAHALGRCHSDRSGFDGPWTYSPTVFTNDYFAKLLEETWVPRKWRGPDQFENASDKALMMLPSDMALLSKDEYRKWIEAYAKDEELFFKDFASAFQKLTENGCKNLQYTWWETIFG